MSDLSSDSGGKSVSGRERAQGGDARALSSAQLGIWFAQKIDPSSAAYNIGEYIEIEGPVVLPLFERALRQAVDEAQTLRLQISEQDGEPRQTVSAPLAFSLPIVDVSTEPDARAVAEAWMKDDLARPVDPARGPLFGFALFKVSAERFFWYARYHHIALDGFGMGLVARRVAEIYTALCAGQAAAGDAFGALAGLLDEDAAYRASEQVALDRRYWADALAAHPDPGSLTLSAHPPVRSGNFLRATENVPRSCVEGLRTLAVQSRTSLARVMAAATAVFLHRLAGADDVVIGLPVAARGAAARRTPGMASNVLPLRLAVHPAMTVAELVGQASSRIREALAHQRYQLADIRRELGGEVDARTLFGVSINVMPFDYGFTFAGHRAIAHNLSLGPVEDLSISVYDRGAGGPLRIDFDVNPALHTQADLEGYGPRFLRLLTAFADAERAVGNLDILDPAERDMILRVWNDTAEPQPEKLLPALFAEQAARTPDAVAVVFEGRELTYAELNSHSNRLAHHLQSLGVAPETVVGLCVERSPEMVIGLLAILKAGGPICRWTPVIRVNDWSSCWPMPASRCW